PSLYINGESGVLPLQSSTSTRSNRLSRVAFFFQLPDPTVVDMSVPSEDYEFDNASTETYAVTRLEDGYAGDGNAGHKNFLTRGDALYAKLQALAGRFGVEQRGIEQVPIDQRTDTSLSKVGTLWLSANMVVSSFAIGVLAVPVFDLNYLASALTIVFINLLGVMPVCFFSTFGPVFGLRQMVLSRFWFGFYGVKIIALFNVLACLGWAAVNVIVGAQLLHAANRDVPGWAGILVIASSTLVVCTFGYRVVHAYERFSWLPSFVLFTVVLGEFIRSCDFNGGNLRAAAARPASSEAGAVLSFAASVFGFATGWTSIAADYTVYQPAGRSRAAVFLWTFAGLFAPLCFTELLGAAVATAVAAPALASAPSAPPPGGNANAYATAYDDAGVGGLLAHVLVPPLGRFGRFCVVALALTTVANNCPNVYSVSMSLQVLAPASQRIPRFAWSAAGTAAYVGVAVAGYGHFAAALENFMLLIGYWLAVYQGVALAEHFAFRRGRFGQGGYRVEDHARPDRLPPGLAALAACGCGAAAAAAGMRQPWFAGPVGRAVGGDVGFEMAFASTAVAYLGLRAVEKRCFGR
ncbi:purine-cytosine permease, partial [Xylariaceae sp. FL0804]